MYVEAYEAGLKLCPFCGADAVIETFASVKDFRQMYLVRFASPICQQSPLILKKRHI